MRQGDPLWAPTMLNIFVNYLFGELENVNNSPVNLGDQENFSSLMYADDLVLMSTYAR